jgi:TPR repeat protein
MPTKDPWAIAFELTAKENFNAALEVLDAHFLANDPLASSLRGHIHWLTSKSDADKLVAKDYFTIGANLGRAYDQRELGKLLHELGLTDEAIDWLTKASEQGDGDASCKLFWLYKRSGQTELSKVSIEKAVTQGNVPATQRYAIDLMLGHYGLGKVFGGIVLYFTNIPSVIRYAKANVR